MPQVTLSNIALDDSDGMRWAKLQRWVREACDQAGIGYTVGGLLTDISLSDSDGMRFAKLQRWLRVLAEGIADAGGSFSGVDPLITSPTELAALPMVDHTLPQIKVWVRATTKTSEIWQAIASSEASDPDNGVIRADDWATSGAVWFKRG